ncbi:hypothetical protein ACJA88_005074 [Fusarium oxysporum]
MHPVVLSRLPQPLAKFQVLTPGRSTPVHWKPTPTHDSTGVVQVPCKPSVHWSAIFQLANCAKYRRLEFNPEAHKSLFSAVYEYPRAMPLSEAPVSPSMLSPPPAQIKSVNDLHGQLLLIQQLYYVIAQLAQAQVQRWTEDRGVQVLGLPGICNLAE